MTLEERLEAYLVGFSPTEEELNLMKSLARDAALLSARVVAGEDVDREAAHLRSQAVSLDAVYRMRMQYALTEFIWDSAKRVRDLVLGSSSS